jgi:hypothetical protein
VYHLGTHFRWVENGKPARHTRLQNEKAERKSRHEEMRKFLEKKNYINRIAIT